MRFVCWLCDKFNNPSPRRLLRRMTNDEINMWLAKYRNEYGDQKQELYPAMICQAILASQGVKTDVKDFIIDWYRKEQTEKEIEDKIRLYFGMV